MSSSLSFFIRVLLWAAAAILFFKAFFAGGGMVSGVLLILITIAALGFSWFDKNRFGTFIRKHAMLPVPNITKMYQGTERYQIYRDIYYHQTTPEDLVRLLDQLREKYTHVRIHYGDLETGEETSLSDGYVSRSSGSPRIPLLVQLGEDDSAIVLDHRILQIDDLDHDLVLYRHACSSQHTPALQPEEADRSQKE
ncbi:MAG: hypothetical protein ACE5G0_11895 [Rhodothermales bacterium]